MVTLTAIAAEKVKGFLEGQDTAGLRVGVRGGGCSGFQYALALDEPAADDRVFDVDGIKVTDVDALRRAGIDTADVAKLIIAGFAVRAGLLEVVKASLTGSILGNLLFVGGLSMLVGGWKRAVSSTGISATITLAARVTRDERALLERERARFAAFF